MFNTTKKNKVESVRFTNVVSYLEAEGLEFQCPELGNLVVDVAYDSNFYAILDQQENFPGIQEFKTRQLTCGADILGNN